MMTEGLAYVDPGVLTPSCQPRDGILLVNVFICSHTAVRAHESPLSRNEVGNGLFDEDPDWGQPRTTTITTAQR